MKAFGAFAIALSLSAAMSAQEGSQSFTSVLARKNILNHMDVGVNVGTMGVGVDVAVPVGDYVRVRAGYHYMPRFTINSDFPVETRSGSLSQSDLKRYMGKMSEVTTILEQNGINLDNYSREKSLIDKFSGVELKDKVSMGMRPSMHQFKLLVDVLPFKNNKHWSLTTGIFVGPAQVGDACNKDQEMPLLQAINAYNELYVMSCTWEMLGGGDVYYRGRSLHDTFSKMGVAGFPLGTFARDVTRVVTDENGAEHTLVAAKGTKAIMVPSADGTARAEMEVSKVRPYIGFGYNTHLSRNKRWRLNVDAGVMFLCGAPKVYVDNVYSIDESLIDTGNEVYDIVRPNENHDYSVPEDPVTNPMYIVDTPLSHVDLIRDVKGIPGKVGDLVDVVSKFKVYPNATVTFSYRLY